MSNIDFSQIVTAEQIAADALSDARASATSAMTALIGAVAEAATGAVPEAEKLSWTAKEAEARALLSGQIAPGDAAMLAAEAAQTGEPLTRLAETILRHAAAYRTLSATLSGLRRRYRDVIEAAATPEEVFAALESLRSDLSASAR